MSICKNGKNGKHAWEFSEGSMMFCKNACFGTPGGDDQVLDEYGIVGYIKELESTLPVWISSKEWNFNTSTRTVWVVFGYSHEPDGTRIASVDRAWYDASRKNFYWDMSDHDPIYGVTYVAEMYIPPFLWDIKG